MKKVLMSVVLLSLVFLAGLACAEDTDFWFEDNGNKIFYITFPDTWKGEWQEVDGMSVLHALPKDKSLYISIVAVHEMKNLEAAAEMVDSILGKTVKGYDFAKWDDETINDIPVTYSNSTATLIDGGAEVEVMASFFVPQENSVFILYAIGSKEAQDAHQDEIDNILGSLRLTESLPEK